MKNKEDIENFKDTAALLKETVKPLYDFSQRLCAYEHKEEWILFALPAIILLLSARHGSRTFLKMNACVAFFFGISMIFFPKFILQVTFKGEVDRSMQFFYALYGAYVIGSNLFPLFLINSKDKSIFISFYWAKMIESYLIVIDNLITVNKSHLWSYKLLCASTATHAVSGLIMLYFLYNSNHKRAQFHFRLFQVNRIAKIDFFIMMAFGLYFMMYSETLVDSFNIKSAHEGHYMITRINGITLFSMSFISFFCPSFLFEKDKKSFFQYRICGLLLEVLALFYGHTCLGVVGKSELVQYLAVTTVYSGFIFYGLYLCEQQLGEYQNQVEISMCESEASFNASVNQKIEVSEPEQISDFDDSTTKKDN
jgi:hypothetical protein